MSQSIASEIRLSTGRARGGTRVGYERATRGRGRRALRRIPGVLDDAVFLLLAVLFVPVAILAVGAPLALFVRLLVEIAERIWSAGP